MILIILAPKAGHRARERQRFKRIQAAEALAPGAKYLHLEKNLHLGKKYLHLGKTLATGKKFLQQEKTGK